MNDSAGLEAMAQMPGELDDLENLFEFGDIDLNNIPDAESFGNQMQQQQQHPGTHPSTPFQDMTQAPPMPGTSAHDFGGHDQFAMAQSFTQQHRQQPLMSHGDSHAPTSMPFTTEDMYQPVQNSYHPHSQGFPMPTQHAYPPHQQFVPPTPNSLEMHGMAARFMQQQAQLDAQQRAIMEQRYGLRKEDVQFTPIVSPAGTPQYNMLPEFTTPGAYFSPLTSPMLHAQNQQHQQQMQHQQGYITNPSTAPSSNTNSPIDLNADVDMGNTLNQMDMANKQPRKSGRRKIATAKGAGAAARTSKSAAQKSQKRKSSQLQDQAQDLALRPTQSQPVLANLQMPGHIDGSEAESISPEPLSESLMGPPPRPGSATVKSPSIAGQQQRGANAVGSAATPKSLLTMRMQDGPNGPATIAQNGDGLMQDLGGLEDLSLPEAATKSNARRASLTVDTQSAANAIDDTPRLAARKTPKLGPSSTPTSVARSQSVVQSPLPMSPMTASTPAGMLREKEVKGHKKRSNTSTSSSRIVSPALVPKISPSIKPLLPEGTPLNTATQAMLLASKSNYQNLLEGNRLPGVNYPDSLSTGLTSKRTSHKVAEQGRRNRINEALREMQSLIPKLMSGSKSPATPAMNGGQQQTNRDGDASPPAEDGEGKSSGNEEGMNGISKTESKEEAVAKSNSSKAATVELANEYIKKMQKEQAEREARILALEREKEELVRRLGAKEGGGEGGGGEVKSIEA